MLKEEAQKRVITMKVTQSMKRSKRRHLEERKVAEGTAKRTKEQSRKEGHGNSGC